MPSSPQKQTLEPLLESWSWARLISLISRPDEPSHPSRLLNSPKPPHHCPRQGDFCAQPTPQHPVPSWGAAAYTEKPKERRGGEKKKVAGGQ